jgi:hypothetical protein
MPNDLRQTSEYDQLVIKSFTKFQQLKALQPNRPAKDLFSAIERVTIGLDFKGQFQLY